MSKLFVSGVVPRPSAGASIAHTGAKLLKPQADIRGALLHPLELSPRELYFESCGQSRMLCLIIATCARGKNRRVHKVGEGLH